MKFHAQTVEECWRIARACSEHHQQEMNRAALAGKGRLMYEHQIARNACDDVAQQILHGRRVNGRRMRK